jgi:ribonuclease HII
LGSSSDQAAEAPGVPPASGGSRRKRRKGSDGRRTAWLFRFDREFGCRHVAGADEAGRGCLAGPLVAAGVLLDYERLGPAERRSLAGLDDSKRKTQEEREALYPAVLAAAERVVVTARCAPGIDARGLHVTNLQALADCLGRVAVPGAKCLSDGFSLGSRCAVPHQAVVGGDARSAAIAAASVVAKVSRDRYMQRAAGRYPDWDFGGNVGYSTPEHRQAIAEVGICDLHRRSFASTAYSQLELGA